MRSLLFLLIGVTLTFSANASNWIYIGLNDRLEQYIDTDSISKDGDYRTAFIKTIYYKDQIGPDFTYNSLIVLAKYDCVSRPKKTKALSLLAKKDEESLESFNVESVTKWNITYPDSIGETTANFICSY